MKPQTHHTSIHLTDDIYNRVKETADRLGLSVNKVITIALCEQLPLDFADLVWYYTEYIPDEIQKPASPL